MTPESSVPYLVGHVEEVVEQVLHPLRPRLLRLARVHLGVERGILDLVQDHGHHLGALGGNSIGLKNCPNIGQQIAKE